MWSDKIPSKIANVAHELSKTLTECKITEKRYEQLVNHLNYLMSIYPLITSFNDEKLLKTTNSIFNRIHNFDKQRTCFYKYDKNNVLRFDNHLLKLLLEICGVPADVQKIYDNCDSKLSQIEWSLYENEEHLYSFLNKDEIKALLNSIPNGSITIDQKSETIIKHFIEYDPVSPITIALVILPLSIDKIQHNDQFYFILSRIEDQLKDLYLKQSCSSISELIDFAERYQNDIIYKLQHGDVYSVCADNVQQACIIYTKIIDIYTKVLFDKNCPQWDLGVVYGTLRDRGFAAPYYY